MEAIQELSAIVEEPLAYARKLQEQTGKKIIGYMCTYAPEEIIFAAGAHPLRLFGSNKNIFLADGHLQSYCCSLVRSVLEDALSGNLNFLTCMIFPHTCDSIQRLSDIWRLNIPDGFHQDVLLPAKLDTKSAQDYLLAVLDRFRSDLEEKLQIHITAEDLKKSIVLYNEIRSGLKNGYELKNKDPEIISGHDLSILVKAAMIMERSDYLKILQNVIAGLEKKSAAGRGTGARRLVISGGVCNSPDIYSVIEQAGGVVVGDDLCTGSRYYEGIINNEGDPVAAIAQRYLLRPVCPAKHLDNNTRAQNLLEIVRKTRATGVVFLLLKFCDPHAFDYPYLKEALKKVSIPSLLLEVEDQPQAQGQMRTRIEAFLETL